MYCELFSDFTVAEAFGMGAANLGDPVLQLQRRNRPLVAGTDPSEGHLTDMRTLFTLLCALLTACTTTRPPADPWWASARPCDDGQILQGGPPIEPGVVGMVWCASRDRPARPDGRYARWHENGQLAEEGVWRGPVPTEIRVWDEAGRLVMERAADTDVLKESWWHPSGTLAVRGERVRGKAHGVWIEQDASGQKVAEVVFEHGVMREVRLDDSHLLWTLDAVEATASPGLTAPRSDSLHPLGGNIDLTLADDRLLLSGEPLSRGLEDLDALRDALRAKATLASKQDLRLLAHAERPWSDVEAILRAAEAAGIVEYQLVVASTTFERWPARRSTDRSPRREALFGIPMKPGPTVQTQDGKMFLVAQPDATVQDVVSSLDGRHAVPMPSPSGGVPR